MLQQVEQSTPESVKKQESHPIEQFWNEYNRKREMEAAGQA